MRKKQTPIEYIVNSLERHFSTLGRDGVEYRISDVHLKTMIRYAKKLDGERLLEYWIGGMASQDEGGLSFDEYHNGKKQSKTILASDVKSKLVGYNGFHASIEIEDGDTDLDIMNKFIDIAKNNSIEDVSNIKLEDITIEDMPTPMATQIVTPIDLMPTNNDK